MTAIYIKMAYHDIDSISYVIPDNYNIEFLPESVTIKTKFRTYKTEFIQDSSLIFIYPERKI